MAKIGSELYIEALREGLALKTVNGARSAYACFLFKKCFFHSYNDGRNATGDLSEPLKCVISVKSCLAVFKALSTLEKTVDRCRLHLDPDENKLVFIFHCKHSIMKTHNLGFQECEALQAVFTKDLCPNHIAGPARTLSDVATNFPNGLDEVTMIANPLGVVLKNYVEQDDDASRAPLTEVRLLPDEFDVYQIGVDSSLTYCLKELRAILLFTDAINHSLSMRFEAAGKPIVFSIDDSQDYQADFVLATLLDGTSSSQTQTSSLATMPRNIQGGVNETTTDAEAIQSNHAVEFPEEDLIDTRKQRQSSHSNSSAGSNGGPVHAPHTELATTHLHSGGVTSEDGRRANKFDVMDALFENDNMDEVADNDNVYGFGRKETYAAVALPLVLSRGTESARGRLVQSTPLTKPLGLHLSVEEDSDLTQVHISQASIIDDSGFIPSTPPAKKFKPMSVLFGMEMFANQDSQSEVLAPDSESDSD